MPLFYDLPIGFPVPLFSGFIVYAASFFFGQDDILKRVYFSFGLLIFTIFMCET